MSKFIKYSGASLAAALLLASCGQGGGAGGAQGGGDEITLKVMSTTMAADPEMSAEQAIADAFMDANPGIKIEFIPVAYPDYGTTITTVATSQDIPDIFANGPELSALIEDLGIAQDLTPLLGEEFIAGFDQDVLSESYVNDQLAYAPYYSIPMSLIYRIDLLEEAGVEPPETWNDFIDVAEALTIDTNGDGSIDQWGFAMVGTADASGGARFAPILRAFGAADLQKDGDQWKTTIDSDAGVKAIQFYADLVTKHDVVPPGALSTAYPDAVNLMASGQAAMIISGSHAVEGIIAASDGKLEGKFGSVPLPRTESGEHVSVLGQLGFSISDRTEHAEAAAEYLKFYLSQENQIAWTKATGRIPTRIDALESEDLDHPQYEGFMAAMQYGYETPAVPYYLTVQTIAAEAYQAVISGTSADVAAQEAAKRINDEISANE